MLDNLYEKLFDLRNKQANVSPDERQAIQEEIKGVLELIDALGK
jgi:hypothetical protein